MRSTALLVSVTIKLTRCTMLQMITFLALLTLFLLLLKLILTIQIFPASFSGKKTSRVPANAPKFYPAPPPSKDWQKLNALQQKWHDELYEVAKKNGHALYATEPCVRTAEDILLAKEHGGQKERGAATTLLTTGLSLSLIMALSLSIASSCGGVGDIGSSSAAVDNSTDGEVHCEEECSRQGSVFTTALICNDEVIEGPTTFSLSSTLPRFCWNLLSPAELEQINPDAIPE